MREQLRQSYFEHEVLHADPLRLIVMLYRAALESAGKARRHLRSGDIANRVKQITRASEIVNELAMNVDRERGGEIAANLVELYDYMQRLLHRANFEQIEAPLAELERLMAVLLEAWEKCAGPQGSGADVDQSLKPVLVGERAGSRSPVSLSA